MKHALSVLAGLLLLAALAIMFELGILNWC